MFLLSSEEFMQEKGRSMVEMLGVLAIIGVLSVGAISGYSKAMFKYKLNKQAEQLSTIINAGLRYAGTWNFTQNINLVPYFIKLGEVPENMIKDSSQYIYDVFNTRLGMGYTINDENQHYTQFYIMLDTSDDSDYSLSICRNIVNISKEFHANLWKISILNQGSEGALVGDGETWDGKTYMGDAYCTGGSQCLKDMTMEDIDTFCRYNLDKTEDPHIKLVWME